MTAGKQQNDARTRAVASKFMRLWRSQKEEVPLCILRSMAGNQSCHVAHNLAVFSDEPNFLPHLNFYLPRFCLLGLGQVQGQHSMSEVGGYLALIDSFAKLELAEEIEQLILTIN